MFINMERQDPMPGEESRITQIIACHECGWINEVHPSERPMKGPDGSTTYFVFKCRCGFDLSDYVLPE